MARPPNIRPILYITIHNPSDVNLGNGPKTPINLKNGVYELKVREISHSQDLCAEEAVFEPSALSASPAPLAPAVADPYGGAASADTGAPIVRESESESDKESESREGEIVERAEGENIDAPIEAAPVRVVPNPMLPSQEDIDKHFCSGHSPFRSWCDICVKSRGVDDPHSLSHSAESKEPYFSCDYCFPGSADNPEDKLTVYVVKEHRSK